MQGYTFYCHRDFNPRSPHGERRRNARDSFFDSPFQSTLPARGATGMGLTSPPSVAISIHAPRTGSDSDLCCGFIRYAISIHAPRTGSDALGGKSGLISADFNPRSPHGERRAKPSGISVGLSYFNPRSPHGERHLVIFDKMSAGQFQSTLPARGATGCSLTFVSIKTHFNPRSPHGERLFFRLNISNIEYFNPRSPHGERRCFGAITAVRDSISIHAPRTGSDDNWLRGNALKGDFNPRSPHGERPIDASRTGNHDNFNPRSPHGERP